MIESLPQPVLAATSVLLVNPVKPLLFAALAVAWGWCATQVDKDAGYFYLAQRSWSAAHLAAALVGFGLMLLIPIFWVGLVVGPAIAASTLVGYVWYRNPKVPPDSRWYFSTEMLTRRLAERQRAQAQKRASYRLMTPDEEPLQVPTGDEPFVTAHQKLEELLSWAVPRGADRLDMQANKQQVVVSVRIDGVRYDHSTLEPQVALELVDYLKEAAGLDVEEQRKRQTGELLVEREPEQKEGKASRHVLEITAAGSTRGVQLGITIDRTALANISLKDLGLLDAQRQQLDKVLQGQGGIVLTTAPARQGLTTLTYALMQEHDPYTSSVVTLEDTVPFEAEGVGHNEMEAGYTNEAFYKRLATLLRRDPDVMMLSHVPDGQVAELMCKNAEEVRFYAALREPETFAALRQWVELTGSKRVASESLSAIVASRLVRKLCETCRKPYKPDPSALKRLNLSSDKVSRLYQASGEVEIKDRDRTETCPTCLGLGYRGRVGVYEVMPLDGQARAFVGSGEFDRLRSHLRKQKVLWLQEAALNKVVEGVTDIKEVTRVMGEKRTSGSSRGGKQQGQSPDQAEAPVQEQSQG
jgi:type II secretory ATPase GspE/PulE/Tfp pilus assembly ATPase PilB-like protein